MDQKKSPRQLSEFAMKFSEVASDAIDRSSTKGNFFKVGACKLKLTFKIYFMSISGGTTPADYFDKKIELAELFAKWAKETNSIDSIIKDLPKEEINSLTADQIRESKAPNFASIIDQAYKA